MIPDTAMSISSMDPVLPSEPLLGGSYGCKHPFSSDGVSTSLEQTLRVHRYLSVRYDGFAKVALWSSPRDQPSAESR